jgi:hypothetical protein
MTLVITTNPVQQYFKIRLGGRHDSKITERYLSALFHEVESENRKTQELGNFSEFGGSQEA